MRKRLTLLALAVVLASGLCLAAPPDTNSPTKEAVQAHLDRAKVNQHGSVQASLNGGVVTLTGTVDELKAKQDAEKAAWKTPGVTWVVNNIQVHAEEVTDQSLVRQVYHELVMYYAYGIFDYVNPQVENGTLVVNGYVTQPFKKTDLGRIFAQVKGVKAVQNNLEVLPPSSFDDRLRMQLARAIYGSPYFTPYANLAVPPIHIVVKNMHVTLEGVVNYNIDKVNAGMAANRTGLSFSVVNNLRVVKG